MEITRQIRAMVASPTWKVTSPCPQQNCMHDTNLPEHVLSFFQHGIVLGIFAKDDVQISFTLRKREYVISVFTEDFTLMVTAVLPCLRLYDLLPEAVPLEQALCVAQAFAAANPDSCCKPNNCPSDEDPYRVIFRKISELQCCKHHKDEQCGNPQGNRQEAKDPVGDLLDVHDATH